MDTRLLHTFTTLARTGSFTATAAELHLAQSTVTVHIRTLERELATPLFDRLPTGTVLTDPGRRLLERAEDVLDAVARLRADPDVIAGRVTVGAPESLCSTRLPQVIGALRARHPEVEVQLSARGTAACVEGLLAGRLDLALLFEAEVSDVAAEPVGHEPLALLGAPGHPLAGHPRPITWEELAAESFFLLEQGCSYSDDLERRLRSVPGSRPRLTRFGSVDATRACVAAGLGLTLLPLATVREQLRHGHLVRLAGPPLPDVPVQLARHPRRWTSPAADAFAGLLRAAAP
ncbi:LysR family transcriptional regulator [Streptomyces xiamenensis]|uniref:LysR family transcriptional regulator n=1 Tax=Streptomyces xiamenensis TaxID=408015 RepID=UPI0036E526DE